MALVGLIEQRAAELEKKLRRKDEVLAELMEEHVALKRTFRGASGASGSPTTSGTRSVDFVNRWTEKTEFPMTRLTTWIGIRRGKFSDWRERYGRVNEHNAWVPRDHWLEAWETQVIVGYWMEHADVGYLSLTYMMLDGDIVAVSLSSVYRVVSEAGLLEKWNRTPSKKGTGFVQPARPHEHWHIDIAHLNLGGTFQAG